MNEAAPQRGDGAARERSPRALAGMEEGALIERVKRGDAAAYDELVRRYLRRAFAVAYRVLRQREDAEDVIQEAFAGALEHIDSFESGRPFGPWLFRIVVNRALNARRSRALRSTDALSEDLPDTARSPARDLERSEARGRLRRALSSLTERQRIIVGLFELEGFTSAEIGAMLELSDGTVRWHLHQARAALRAALGQEEKAT